jgi:RNA polymerase sigma-B factor
MASTMTTLNRATRSQRTTSANAHATRERRALEAHGVSVQTLFARCQNGDRAARETLVTRFMPLARKVARRYWNSSLPREDLAQVANLALIKAIDRFDSGRGRPFEAFAVPTILGELRRCFRDSSWAVHVARGAQERSKAVQDAIELLARDHGRSPTVQQLALYLELPEEDILDALQVGHAYTATSLDAPVQNGEEETTLACTLGEHDDGYEHVETAMLMENALACLTDHEQRLLILRFVDELTQAQIGKQLGVSQMQVSRLLRATLAKLRDHIGEPSIAQRQLSPRPPFVA